MKKILLLVSIIFLSQSLYANTINISEIEKQYIPHSKKIQNYSKEKYREILNKLFDIIYSDELLNSLSVNAILDDTKEIANKEKQQRIENALVANITDYEKQYLIAKYANTLRLHTHKTAIVYETNPLKPHSFNFDNFIETKNELWFFLNDNSVQDFKQEEVKYYEIQYYFNEILCKVISKEAQRDNSPFISIFENLNRKSML
jgi:hypothetical protein